MDKPKWTYKLIEYFGLPDETKIVYFRNPNETNLNTCYIDMYNPTHKGFLWGRRKNKHLPNPIKVGKVYLPSFVTLFIDKIGFWIDIMFRDPLFTFSLYYMILALMVIVTIANIPVLEVLISGGKGLSSRCL